MSDFPALTKAAGNFLCIVCCFNTTKQNSNGEEENDDFFCLFGNLWVFCVWQVLEFSSVLKTHAQTSTKTQPVAGNGRGRFKFLLISRAPVALCWLQVLGQDSTSHCSSFQWDFYWPQLPQLRDHLGPFWALCTVEKKLLFVGLEGIGRVGVWLFFKSFSGTINLFFPIIFTDFTPEFDPPSVIFQ